MVVYIPVRLRLCPELGSALAWCGPVPARCGPAGPRSITFARQLQPSDPLTPYFYHPDPIWSKICSHMGSNLHGQTVKSDGFASEGCRNHKTSLSQVLVTQDQPKWFKSHTRGHHKVPKVVPEGADGNPA